MEKKNIDWGNIGFGYIPTDYRYVSNYKDGKWDDGQLTQDPNIVLNECAGVLQYAQTRIDGDAADCLDLGIASVRKSGSRNLRDSIFYRRHLSIRTHRSHVGRGGLVRNLSYIFPRNRRLQRHSHAHTVVPFIEGKSALGNGIGNLRSAFRRLVGQRVSRGGFCGVRNGRRVFVRSSAGKAQTRKEQGRKQYGRILFYLPIHRHFSLHNFQGVSPDGNASVLRFYFIIKAEGRLYIFLFPIWNFLWTILI